jgi:hypothetical protein
MLPRHRSALARRQLLRQLARRVEHRRGRQPRAHQERAAALRQDRIAARRDVGDEDYADAIHDKCRRNGLLVSTEGSTVLLLPSLAIDKRPAAKGLDILAHSI